MNIARQAMDVGTLAFKMTAVLQMTHAVDTVLGWCSPARSFIESLHGGGFAMLETMHR